MKIKEIFFKYWAIIMVLLLAASLRLSGLLLNPISLYSDEVDMGYQAYSLLKTGCDYQGYCLPVQFHSFSDVQPPIPIYLIALIHGLGVSLDLSIRLIPAIFGVLGIFMTYLLFNRLATKKLFNLDLPNIGLWSSLILTLIPWHLTYSRIGFSLALLYFFVVSGLYFFTRYLDEKKDSYLYLAFAFLGLSPMVYNTAKMAIVFYPAVLLLIPGAFEQFKKKLNFKIALVVMYIPLAVLFLGGDTAARFDYISVFSDPTASPEVNYERLQDAGPMASVGSSPSLLTKVFHNKPLWFANNLSDNVFGLMSTNFLFTAGDPNLRHSPADWGMIYRFMAPVLFMGIYFLIRYRHDRLLILLGLLTAIAISTSAITREGSNHASRSFMMILPLVFLSGVGLAYVFKHWKMVSYLLLGSIMIESIFFVHSYWSHYRFASERAFSAGMKEMIAATGKYPDQPVVVSPKYEHPLIFWLYYTRFDPARFQTFAKNKTVYNSTEGKNNLEGNRIGDTHFYIATPVDSQYPMVNGLPGAVYFLTRAEVEKTSLNSAPKLATITLPSGEILYYAIR